MIPAKTYYLELDGEPSCCSPRRALASPGWACAQASLEEAKQSALLVWRDHPDCAVAIKEGPCPRGEEGYDSAMEYYARYDDDW
jgi:hypothetical protein